MAWNGFASGIVGFVKPRPLQNISQRLLDIRIYYGPNQYSHRGVKEFVYRLLPDFRLHNPTVPVIVTPHYIRPEIPDPWIWGRYEHGRQKKYKLTDRSCEQVLCIVEDFACEGLAAAGRLATRPVRGMTLLPTEQKNRDPFVVLSKK